VQLQELPDLLRLIADRAASLREAGVRRVSVDGLAFDLAEWIPPRTRVVDAQGQPVPEAPNMVDLVMSPPERFEPDPVPAKGR